MAILRAVTDDERREGSEPSMAEVLRDLMLACRRAEDAIYRHGSPRDLRSYERSCGTLADALEFRLKGRAIMGGPVYDPDPDADKGPS